MKKSIPKVREWESEASILGNDREREFPLTPVPWHGMATIAMPWHGMATIAMAWYGMATIAMAAVELLNSSLQSAGFVNLN